MWMRRGRDGSEDEREGTGSHAIGVGAVVVILDGAAATGDPALDGEPVGLGSDDDDDGGAPGRRVVVPQSALRLVDDADQGVVPLTADDLPPRA
jgi:hypothetical protein